MAKALHITLTDGTTHILGESPAGTVEHQFAAVIGKPVGQMPAQWNGEWVNLSADHAIRKSAIIEAKLVDAGASEFFVT